MCFTVKNYVDGTVQKEKKLVITDREIKDDFKHLTLILKPGFTDGAFDLVLLSDDTSILGGSSGYRIDMITPDARVGFISGATIAYSGITKSASLPEGKKRAIGSDEDIFLCAFYGTPGDDAFEHVPVSSSDEFTGRRSYVTIEMSYDGQYHEFVTSSDEQKEGSGIVKSFSLQDGQFAALMQDGTECLVSESAREGFVYSKSHGTPVSYAYQTGYYADDEDKKEIRYAQYLLVENYLSDYLTIDHVEATVYKCDMYKGTVVSEKTDLYQGDSLQKLLKKFKEIDYLECSETVTGKGYYSSITFKDADGNTQTFIQDGLFYFLLEDGVTTAIGRISLHGFRISYIDFSQLNQEL